jgi:hypothetical protein
MFIIYINNYNYNNYNNNNESRKFKENIPKC